ncbi:MAG: alanine racemase [Actinomycetota bacterium]|nr:alanine racemase [Actinomycetota bacterium]MDQ2957317.1 alanine racemase [Actinomycetota bacterium]
MKRKAEASEVSFRPHFKTHNSRSVGRIFRTMGVDKITVSSVTMAEYFAAAGWSDITIAFPVDVRAIARLKALGEAISLNLILDSVEAVNAVASAGVRASSWLDLDTGYRRTGVPAGDRQRIVSLATSVHSAGLELRGILTHAGHSYSAASTDQVVTIWNESVLQMVQAREWIASECGISPPISVGDTPGCSLVPVLENVDEIRPGNFVFYDLQQLTLGSCTADRLALAVECPIVGVYPDRGEVVIHGGAVHLSKEYLTDRSGEPVYGGVLQVGEDGWQLLDFEAARITSLSQEHGVVTLNSAAIRQLHVGDVLLIAPVHACLAANGASTPIKLVN